MVMCWDHPNYVEVNPKVESFWGALGCPGVPRGALGVLQGTLGGGKGVFERSPRGPWRAKIMNCTHSRAVWRLLKGPREDHGEQNLELHSLSRRLVGSEAKGLKNTGFGYVL